MNEIPAIVLDCELGLVYDCPYKVWEYSGHVGIEEEVEGEVVAEVAELPEGLERKMDGERVPSEGMVRREARTCLQKPKKSVGPSSQRLPLLY